MSEKRSAAEKRLPLKPIVFQILLVLSGGERHGYNLVKELEQRMEGGKRILPGNLYRTLRRMRDDGLIAESDWRPDPAVDDERRRYFKVTEFGERVARAEALRLERLVDDARAHRLLPEAGGRS